MKFRKVSPSVGLEIKDVNLNEALNEDQKDFLLSTLANTGLLIFRSQEISPAKLVEFSSSLGEARSYTRSQFGLEGFPEILVLSNIKENGRVIGSPVSGRVWHVDGHYMDEIPRATILAMKILHKEGGNTSFANMQAAWLKLPKAVAESVENLRINISRVQSREYNYPERGPVTDKEREEWKNVIHPLLLHHPVNGRLGLGVGGNVPWNIPGMSPEEAIPLVTFCQEWCTRKEFVYEHVWREGDVLVWDNWTVMHKASPYSGDRLLHRTTIY